MKLAYVLWEDACELDATPWAEHEENFEYTPTLCKQVGFILYDGEEGIVITEAIINGDTAARRNQIPRGMIRRIEWLTEPSF